jgi:hypothetical protein
MPTPTPRGRYEVRPHPSIGGLVTIVFIDATSPSGQPVINLGQPAVPLFAKALNDYMAKHPGLASVAEGEIA